MKNGRGDSDIDNRLVPQAENSLIEEIWKVYNDSMTATLIRDVANKIHIKYNRAMQDLTGYAHMEVFSLEDWLTKLYPEDSYRSYILKIIEDEARRNFNHKAINIDIVRKDGVSSTIDFILHEVLINEEPTDLHIMQAIDNTQKKKIRDEMDTVNNRIKSYNGKVVQQVLDESSMLEENEERLKMALEGANEGLWIIDFIHNKMFFNPRTAAMLGYSLEELGETQEDWNKLNHPEDWPGVEKALQDHFEGKKPFYEAQYRMKTKNGGWKWILGHGKITKRDENGTPIQAIGTHVDIDNLKRVEFDLRASEEKFRSLVEHAPFGFLMMDWEGSIVYSNTKFSDIFGRSRKAIGSLAIWLKNAIEKKDLRELVKHSLNAIEKFHEPDDSYDSLTLTIKSNRGKKKTISLHMVMLEDKKCFFTFQDITLRVNAETQLHKRSKELERKTKELEEVNTALRVLLKSRENDRNEMEEKIMHNLKDLVFPYIERLNRSSLDDEQQFNLDILKSNLNEIVSPFSRQFAMQQINMTPTEIRIAKLIREDKITKEISSFMHISESAVEFHRYNIRKKLNLLHKKVNLRSYLQSV